MDTFKNLAITYDINISLTIEYLNSSFTDTACLQESLSSN